MNNTDTNLIEALNLARLPAKERFTMENIQKIHNGIKPYYKLLTSYDLPDDVIIVGFGADLRDGCFDYNSHKTFVSFILSSQTIYYTRTSTAIEKGWWREPIKWIWKRRPTIEDCRNLYETEIIVLGIGEERFYGFRSFWDGMIQKTNWPWQTIEHFNKMTPEEVADIPAEFRWEGK